MMGTFSSTSDSDLPLIAEALTAHLRTVRHEPWKVKIILRLLDEIDTLESEIISRLIEERESRV